MYKMPRPTGLNKNLAWSTTLAGLLNCKIRRRTASKKSKIPTMTRLALGLIAHIKIAPIIIKTATTKSTILHKSGKLALEAYSGSPATPLMALASVGASPTTEAAAEATGVVLPGSCILAQCPLLMMRGIWFHKRKGRVPQMHR